MVLQINKGLFIKALTRAIYKTYYAEIVKNTPGKGIVADGWDVVSSVDEIKIVNPEYGEIVTYLEYGTNPHIIRAKNKKSLRWQVGPGDKFAFAKSVKHPGIKARKFIHNVLEDPTVHKNFEKELEIEIKKLLI